MTHDKNTPEARTICDLVLHELKMSVSEREWKHRLRGYGYGIKQTIHGAVVTSLVRNHDLCELPDQVTV